jgi:hydrogenase maturation protease
VTVVETSMAGLSFLDLLAGYDKAIIIDAIQTDGGKAGQIYRLDSEALGLTRHAASPHDMDFGTALELGKRLGMVLPQQVTTFAIEVADANTLGEECTPEVRRAIPTCVEMIIRELKGDASA